MVFRIRQNYGFICIVFVVIVLLVYSCRMGVDTPMVAVFQENSITEQHSHESILDANKNTTYIFPSQLPKGSKYEKEIRKFVIEKDQLIFNNVARPKFANDVDFSTTQFKINNHNNDENLEHKECKENVKAVDINVSPLRNINVDLHRVLTKFLNENSTYYQEVRDLIPELPKQLATNTFHQYWFQFMGSSVWLEQYGVHLMTSRIFYTKTGSKVKPVVSFIYTQVFDLNWKEMDNVTLVIPIEGEGVRNEVINGNRNRNMDRNLKKKNKKVDIGYKLVQYPNFVQVPAYHNHQKQSGRFYGAEDPRLLLVRNKLGVDEPVVIYNSYHRKISKYREVSRPSSSDVDNDNEETGVTSFKFHRSMFIGWLWQTQSGKENVDELDQKHAQNMYIRVKELVLPLGKREKKEKNWTPFVDYKERVQKGYDDSLKFVYQFKDLRILRCLFDKETCEWEYELQKNKLSISPFRGGTELISLSQILATRSSLKKSMSKSLALTSTSSSDSLSSAGLTLKLTELQNQLQIQDGEIWIGLARTALKSCGCGSHFYRPNLVVLFKLNNTYLVIQTSSSLDFNVPALNWDVVSNDESTNICQGKNLIMPTGISYWDLGSGETDILTLTLARADSTVDIIYVKGILKEIFLLLVNPHKSIDGNSIVKCAIDGALDYCKAYAKENGEPPARRSIESLFQ